MQSIAWPDLAGALFFLLGIAIPIWVAWKAPPLGPFAYRWGVYNGIEIALVALIFLVFGLSAFVRGVPAGASILVLMSLVSALAAVGVLKRRRWGALLCIATLALMALLSPLFALIANGPDATQSIRNLIPVLIVLAVDVVYFRKRWQALS